MEWKVISKEIELQSKSLKTLNTFEADGYVNKGAIGKHYAMVIVDINEANTEELEMTTLEWQVILDQKNENGGTIPGGVYWEEKVVKLEKTFNYF
jgi:hypothetical protein